MKYLSPEIINLEIFPSFKSADNCYLFDFEGNKYFDSASGLWNVNCGHNNININTLLNNANEILTIDPFQYSNLPAENLATKLLDFYGNKYCSVLFACSGSEAVEIALHIARQYQLIHKNKNKTKIGTFQNDFHGMSCHILSMNSVFSLTKSVCVPANSLNDCKIIDTDSNYSLNDIAGIIFEPIQGANGGIIADKNKMQQIFSECHNTNTLIISDEIAVGLGRSGDISPTQELFFSPDILIIGKALSNGLVPLSAILFNAKVFNTFKDNGVIYGHTYTAFPLGIKIANAVIDFITINKLVDRSALYGNKLEQELGNRKYINNFDWFGKGLFWATKLNKKSNYEVLKILKKNFLLSHLPTIEGENVTLTIVPPLTINEIEFSDMLNRLENVCKDLLEN